MAAAAALVLGLPSAPASGSDTIEGIARLLAADTVEHVAHDHEHADGHEHSHEFKGESHDVYRQFFVAGKESFRLKGKTVPNNKPVRLHGTIKGDEIDVESYESAPHAAAIAALPPSGTSRVLVMLAHWTAPDSVTQASAAAQMFTDSSNWYRDNSYGTLGQTGSVTPWMQIAGPENNRCYGDHLNLMNQAKTAAANIGYTLSNFDNYVVYFPNAGGLPGNDCGGFAGWAYVGSTDTWLNGFMDRRVTVHEQGHNYGLWHSHSNLCSEVISGNCSFSDYGNSFDAMGSSNYVGHFGAAQKNLLGWINGSRSVDLSSGGSTTIVPMANDSTAVHAAYVTASSTRSYWLEYRQPTDFDSALPPEATDGVLLNVLGDGSGVTYPPELNFHPAPSLLDVRPADGLSVFSATLRPGQSWLSPEGYRFQVGATDASGASVTVSRAPVISAVATPDPVYGGGRLTVALTAANRLPTQATNVRITNAIPANTTYVPTSASCGGTFASNALTFNLGTLAAGETRTCSFSLDVANTPTTSYLLNDGFDTDVNRWTATHTTGTFDWARTTSSPHSGPNAMMATDPQDQSEQILALTNPLTVPSNAKLRFWHNYETEACCDGGSVEISTDNGANWADLGSNITRNGYNGWSPHGQAFTGSSGGYIETEADLGSYAGTNARIRFRFSSDSSVGGDGWRIDDVRLGTVVAVRNTASVTSTEAGGASSSTSTDVTVLPASVPGAPTIGSASAGNGTAQVSFTAPSDDGGRPITGYTVTSSPGGITANGATSPLTVNSLVNGTTYTFTVRAANAIGSSVASAASNAVTPSAAQTVPGAPTIGTATAENAGATIGFAPPASDGGSAITGYTVMASPGGWTASVPASARSVNIKALTNGTAYRFTMRATNAVGSSAESAQSNQVTPTGIVSYAYPAATGEPVRALFSTNVKQVTTSNFVIQIKGQSTKVAGTKLTCFNASSKSVSCSSGPVRSATLRAGLMPGEIYNAQINAVAAKTKVVPTSGGTIPSTWSAFRTPLKVEEAAPTAFLWRTTSDASASGGSYSDERATGASVSYAFTGPSITWYTVTGPRQGLADVYVDNKLKGTVDNYSASRVFNVARTISGLTNGAHTMKIVVKGTKNAKSLDTFVCVDAIRVGSGAIQSSPVLGFGWGTGASSVASGGAFATSELPGAVASLHFRGTEIVPSFVTGPDGGLVAVYVDGALRTTFDTYASATGTSPLVVGGLTDAVHNVRLVVQGSKHASSTGTKVRLDRWLVT